MKKSELVFSAILVPIDSLMLLAAGMIAYAVRFGPTVVEIRPALYEMPLAEYLNILFLVAGLWIVVFAFSGLYAITARRRILDEVIKIVFACSTGVMLIIVLTFFQRELFSSRFIILLGWILSMVTVSVGRIAIRALQRTLVGRGIGARRIVIIGADATTNTLLRTFHRDPKLGYAIVDRFAGFTPDARARLEELTRVDAVDAVLLADHGVGRSATSDLIAFCNDRHLIFQYTADLFATQATKLDISTIAGSIVIEVKRTPLDGWGKILKRTFDVVVAAVSLLAVAPVLLPVMLIVKMDTEGPAIIGLRRVGENGRQFTLFKVRSMVKNARMMKRELVAFNERPDGPLFKMKADPRITRVGKVLRKLSIDELPQLWNVLRGEMSLVGPRPHEPEEVERYSSHHRKLLTIKPGITGMAQISGRSDLHFSEEVRLDVFYIENWSLKLDLQILLKTPRAVLSTKSAA